MTARDPAGAGPLSSLRIVEFAGIGPAPFGAMLLADLGARIIRIDRPGGYPAPDPSLDFEAMGPAGILHRGRSSLRLDLKSEQGKAVVLRLIEGSDALIEGYRPGTMERLGLGPDVCFAANPRLAYVRMTGWGQEGPLARSAGHDLNYIGLSGALSLLGRDGAPPVGVPPMIGDMGGGGLFMAFGLLAAVLEARQSGRGQVVDAAIVDGSAALYALLKSLNHTGAHAHPAGRNILDGGRHYYRTYRCADGKYVAVGAIEPAFRKAFLETLDLLSDPRFTTESIEDDAYCTERLERIFAAHPRGYWEALFSGKDACVTPVLSMDEAPAHDQARARTAFVTVDGIVQHAPAPRYSRTPGQISVPPKDAGRSNPAALMAWGFTDDELAALAADGIIE